MYWWHIIFLVTGSLRYVPYNWYVLHEIHIPTTCQCWWFLRVELENHFNIHYWGCWVPVVKINCIGAGSGPDDWLLDFFCLTYDIHNIYWIVGSWLLIYGGFRLFLDEIHVVLLWRIIGVIMSQIDISIGVIDFMGFVISMVFLIIFLHVFICGIIFILGGLMFGVVWILRLLIIVLLVHWCNIRHHIHSWNVFSVVSNGISFSIIKS